MKRMLRLSQCMIVKNEEDDIRRALSWGKGIVCEQIVVDTGSEDNTVTIAEEMGATVYHFEWNDDFSAAKNFALSKAKGDWIAFLDADEYFPNSDIPKIRELLTFLNTYPPEQRPDVIRCKMMHLDEEGKIFSTTMQDRLIRRDRRLQYEGRIHEKLVNAGKPNLVVYDAGDLFSIYHTGYASNISRKKNKADRNLSILQKEVAEHPEQYWLWSYIGDSLLAKGNITGALDAFRNVIAHADTEMEAALRLNAFSNAERVLGMLPFSTLEEVTELYKQYEAIGGHHPDMEYWTGQNLLRFGKRDECALHLEKALYEMENEYFPFTVYVAGELEQVYSTLALIYAHNENKNKAVKYAVLALRAQRYQDEILKILLLLFKENAEQPQNVYSFLSKIYDFSSSKDVFFVYKAAKLIHFYQLEDHIYHTLSESEIAYLEESKPPLYFLSEQQAAEQYPSLPYQNSTDIHFLELMEEIQKNDLLSLTSQMVHALQEELVENKDAYENTLSFYKHNTFWGKLDPAQEEYELFQQRTNLIKEHRNHIVTLSTNLSDYRSRRTLSALLDNWLHLDRTALQMAAESYPQVFDPDLMPDAKGKVFVDLWATEGNDVRSFIQAYGDSYEKILCYVKSDDDALKLTCNLRGVKRLEIKVCEETEVNINHDIIGATGFIRLHGEGKELQLLDCCSAQIAAYRPALIISAYYGYETLFLLAERILKINPAYHLYLRYHGDFYVPSDYYLIAI